MLIFLNEIHIHSSSFSTRIRLTEYRHIQTELKSTPESILARDATKHKKTPQQVTTSFFMSSFFYYVNPKSSTEERATHTQTDYIPRKSTEQKTESTDNTKSSTIKIKQNHEHNTADR